MLTHGQQHVMSINATAKKDWAGEADMWGCSSPPGRQLI
jgi:hypothetical protein